MTLCPAGSRLALSALWLLLAVSSKASTSSDAILYPGPEQVPEWAQQGKYRFARLDGGPIEILKTARSAWGQHFTGAEKEVLGNLYSKYNGRIIDLLGEAGVNWVWITWSVGYSWQDEAEQRDQCRLLTARMHQKNIHVAAYLCAVSMFWESMFRDEPGSVRWITFDPHDMPYRYSGGRDPLRFIADVNNPQWLEYQKRRIGAAIDAGIDSFFLDNTASSAWADNTAIDRFIGRLRRYIREEKHSNAVLLTNYGLAPDRIGLNRNMEVVFNEHWMEPGVWGEEWNASNVRRMKYARGVAPDWKPLISEYSSFHGSDRAHGWLKPKSASLGIAEAAAFGSAYAWDMEGPFDAALMASDPSALQTWSAIGRYNYFLRDHDSLYWKARPAAPIAVLLAEARPGNVIQFGWDRDDSGLYDLLAKSSILHDIRLLAALDEKQLAAYAAVVLPGFVVPSPEQTAMLQRYRGRGGRIYVLGGAAPQVQLGTVASASSVLENLNTSQAARREVLQKVRALAPDRLALFVDGAPHVLANLTRSGTGKALAIHLLNYAPEPASGVHVRVQLDREFANLTTAQPRLVTPDSGTRGLAAADRAGAAVEFTLQNLDTYGVVVLE